MKVFDLRPAIVRGLTTRWGAQGAASPRGPALVATRLADAWLARQAARRPLPPEAPLVVSIGNLALGGTGKTPVTAQLALDLAAGGVRGAILTRGFGSRLAGPLLVHAGTRGAGDEARLLAGTLEPLGWVVMQSRRRAAGLEWLRRARGALEVILLEDGHQTAGVGRHTDIVILDAWERSPGPGGDSLTPRTGPTAPFGPWRESARGAARAGIWLVEADPTGLGAPNGTQVAGFSRTFRLAGGAPPPRGPVVLLSGIARPQVFEAEVARHLGESAVATVRCADHEPYGARMLARLDRILGDTGARAVVTTAKDAVKLAPVWGSRPPLVVLELRVCWEGTPTLPDLVRERLDAVRRGEPVFR
jgi:tetraacyldisaccharide 4'-kinase